MCCASGVAPKSHSPGSARGPFQFHSLAVWFYVENFQKLGGLASNLSSGNFPAECGKLVYLDELHVPPKRRALQR